MKILLSAAWYPICIASYFKLALEARDDVEIATFGPTSGPTIPWGREFFFPEHAVIVDFVTPFAPGTRMDKFWGSAIKNFDLIIQVDAAYYMIPPDGIPNVVIATDPHCINYDIQRLFANWFFNMQSAYAVRGDYILPYAYCPRTHYPVDIDREPEYDVIINGLPYPQRQDMAWMLRQAGYSVHQGLGEIWDDYREATANARVVYTHSSRNDLIARVFESLAMMMPLVTNRVPALTDFFVPDVDLKVFESNDLETAFEQIEWLLNNPVMAGNIAAHGYQAVTDHTYDARIEELLEIVGA